jgi:hypothetical protein
MKVGRTAGVISGLLPEPRSRQPNGTMDIIIIIIIIKASQASSVSIVPDYGLDD